MGSSNCSKEEFQAILKILFGREASEPHLADRGCSNGSHSDNYVLLTNEPVTGEPGFLVFSCHQYITVRAGPSFSVYEIDAEKWNEKSKYGKNLCSRMSSVGKFKYKKYRVDLGQESELTFKYYVDYINTGSYHVNIDTFRASFCSHLKLYDVACRYGTAGLAEMVLRIISDMLAESHPEQVTRICFWSAVVGFVWTVTKNGDPLRDIISGFPTWYCTFGKGRKCRIHSGTVQHALFKLKILPTPNQLYENAFRLFRGEPGLLEEKVGRYLGEGRLVSRTLTQLWRDTISDPTFENWFNHWKGAHKSKLIQPGEETERLQNSFYDSASSIKMVDDEDRLYFSAENAETEINNKQKKRRGEAYSALFRNLPFKSILRILHHGSPRHFDVGNGYSSPPSYLNEVTMSTLQENKVSRTESDIGGLDKHGNTLSAMRRSEAHVEEGTINPLLHANDQNECRYGNTAHPTGEQTNHRSTSTKFDFDGANGRRSREPFAQNLECISMGQYISPTNAGPKVEPTPSPPNNGTAPVDPRLVALRPPTYYRRGRTTGFPYLFSNSPRREFDVRFSGDCSPLENSANQIKMTSSKIPPIFEHSKGNELEGNAHYEGLDSEEWKERNQPVYVGQYGPSWVECLEEVAERTSRMETLVDADDIGGFHGIPILNKFGQISVWNCEKDVYQVQLGKVMPENFQFDHSLIPQANFRLPCEEICPTRDEWAKRVLLCERPVSTASSSNQDTKDLEEGEYQDSYQDTGELGGESYWVSHQDTEGFGVESHQSSPQGIEELEEKRKASPQDTEELGGESYWISQQDTEELGEERHWASRPDTGELGGESYWTFQQDTGEPREERHWASCQSIGGLGRAIHDHWISPREPGEERYWTSYGNIGESGEERPWAVQQLRSSTNEPGLSTGNRVLPPHNYLR